MFKSWYHSHRTQSRLGLFNDITEALGKIYKCFCATLWTLLRLHRELLHSLNATNTKLKAASLWQSRITQWLKVTGAVSGLSSKTLCSTLKTISRNVPGLHFYFTRSMKGHLLQTSVDTVHGIRKLVKSLKVYIQRKRGDNFQLVLMFLQQPK